MDVLDIIEGDHEAIAALILKLETLADSTADRDISRAIELGQQLATEVHLHVRSEEHVLYRALQQDPTLRDFALAGAHHHHLVDTMLADVRALRPGADGKLRIAVRVLRDVFVRHAREDEEGRIFPILRHVLAETERATLGQAVLAERGRVRAQVEREDERPRRHAHSPPGRGFRSHVPHH